MLFGQPYLPVDSYTVPASDQVMVIDGLALESCYGPQENLQAITDGLLWEGDSDLSGGFRISWDWSNLYIFVSVTDDIAHPLYEGVTDAPWDYDNVEIFLNIDTTGLYQDNSYGDDAIQIRFNRGRPDFISHDQFNYFQKETATGLVFQEFIDYTIAEIGTSGWTIEAAIPWMVILPLGSSQDDIFDFFNKPMGFELSASDSDGADNFPYRETVLFWEADDDGCVECAWYDTKSFGLIELLGKPLNSTLPSGEIITVTDTIIVIDTLFVYNTIHNTDTVFVYETNCETALQKFNLDASEFKIKIHSQNGMIEFFNIDRVNRIEIYDINGRKMKEIDNINAGSLMVDDQKLLQNRIYFAKFHFSDGNLRTLKFVVQ
jgi:hypothetical protein